MKKDWKVTLSYDVKHEDTYLIQNETKEDAIYIAENQNTSPRYDCTCIKEDESDVEDMDTTIREVVFNMEKKDWINKEEEKQKAKAKKEDLISRGLCLKCGEFIKPDERTMNYRGYCPTCQIERIKMICIDTTLLIIIIAPIIVFAIYYWKEGNDTTK